MSYAYYVVCMYVLTLSLPSRTYCLICLSFLSERSGIIWHSEFMRSYTLYSITVLCLHLRSFCQLIRQAGTACSFRLRVLYRKWFLLPYSIQSINHTKIKKLAKTLKKKVGLEWTFDSFQWWRVMDRWRPEGVPKGCLFKNGNSLMR